MKRVATLLVGTAMLAGCAQTEQKAEPTPTTASHQHYATPAGGDKPNAEGQVAPRLQNLGVYTFPVSTKNQDAQLFINQGVNLSWAFNHAESGRAFREAARLDPTLAMAYWGQALVLGPNINAAMEPTAEALAHGAIQQAVGLKANASPREAALIDALAARYSGKAEDRLARDKAYEEAMRAVASQFPDDVDVQVLWAESAMDLRPWGYWMGDGEPHEGVAGVASTLERVIEKSPNHPGALHLYIHLMEAFHPKKAEVAADRLLPLVPGAGHLVHMPSHIYQRVGRYADAMKSNQLAIAADEDYITQCRAQGLYPMGYYPHNLHFLWFAATFDGQSKIALETARKTATKIDPEMLKQMPFAAFKVMPYFALTRFGRWDEMLAEPAPPPGTPYLTGMYHYARGVALAAKGRVNEAARELATVKQIAADPALKVALFSPNMANDVFAIAPVVLSGEISLASRDYDAAISAFERAVRLEDGLTYTEPAEWHYPPRHALGAALLAAGRAAEAETVYWEDLRRNPENGWALFGVIQALRAQNKTDLASIIEARFKKAWTRADVQLVSSKNAK